MELLWETVTFYSDGRAVWTDSDGESSTASYTYDAGSGTIIITAYGETVRWHIVSLTSTSLTIEDEDGYPMTMERVGSSGATDDDDENVAPGGPSGEDDSDFDMSAPSTLLPVADLYPEVSGKYEVSNAESGISFIEMLGDGHYLLQKASASYYMMKKGAGKRTLARRDGIGCESATTSRTKVSCLADSPRWRTICLNWKDTGH